MTKRPSGELKRLAREFLLGNYTTPMLAMLISTFLPAILLSPFSPGTSQQLNINIITYCVAAFIIQILGQLLAVGVNRIHMLLARHQQVSCMDLFWPFFNRPDRLILATLLLYGILLVPAIPAAVGSYYFFKMKSVMGYLFLAGTMFVFLAVEVYIFCTFGLIYMIYLDEPQMSVREGFRTSRRLMNGNKMRMFLLQLSFIGWLILGICSIGIGLLWISPYMTQTATNFYLDLTGQLDAKGEHISAVV